MDWQAWFCLAVLVVVFIGLMRDIASDALLIGALVVVMLAGIIKPADALAGFSNTAMLTVGALFVVAAALRETGALNIIAGWSLGKSRTPQAMLARLGGFVTVMSAFLNNTPIVSMFIPVLLEWSKKNKVAPSRVLIPLSYFTILGGTCTLIGTSTNLVVDGMMRDLIVERPDLADTLGPIGLFELSWVGVPYAIIGVGFILLLGWRWLPDRVDFMEEMSRTAREYLVNLQIQGKCRLMGQSIQNAGLRQLPGLFLIEVNRGDERIVPAPPDLILREGDQLTFTGLVESIRDVTRIDGLTPVAEAENAEMMRRDVESLSEAVVSENAPFLGKTVREADFRALYNAAIVAVHRGGERLKGRVGDITLRPGDTLLLQTGPHFVRANRNKGDFLLVSGVEDSRPPRRGKTLLSLALLGLLITLMTTEYIPTVLACFLVAGLMILFRCLSVSEARQSLDWQTLLTIGAAFGFGDALLKSGLVTAMTGLIVDNMQTLGPLAMLVGLYVLTGIVTELITNNAAAALLFPFGISMAEQIGASPRPFAMAILFAASASFMTPIGYQTNLMVYGPGGYRFSDFLRIGFPLHVILCIAAAILIPWTWPL